MIGACTNQVVNEIASEIDVNEETQIAAMDVNEEEGSELAEADQNETFIFTDSAGREVELPMNIERIAPSGPLAQIVLYTLCPDKMIGLSNEFYDSQKAYIDEKYLSLPVFGQFYGKHSNLNLEALIAAGPDVIIDIGEAKPTVAEDMDGIQQQSNIPVVFIELTLDTVTEAYLKLGELVGEEEQGRLLSDYCGAVVNEAAEKSALITVDERKSIFYSTGDAGLRVFGKGTIHADVIETIGADNIAVLEEASPPGNDVSMEQLMIWQPDVILFTSGSIYSQVGEDLVWSNVEAIQNGEYFEVPGAPYNWIGSPSSVNRIFGIRWLGNLIYPDIYDYDMMKEVKEFYRLFYHYDLTNQEAETLMAHSTLKE